MESKDNGFARTSKSIEDLMKKNEPSEPAELLDREAGNGPRNDLRRVLDTNDADTNLT